MARTSQAIVYEKVREVYRYMTDGSKQTKEVLHFFSEKWTNEGYFTEGISELSKHRHIAEYIKKVRRAYFNYEKDAEIEKSRTLARLDELYSKLNKVQDYKGALSVLREVGEVVGFKAPTKHDMKGSMNIINLGSGEIDKKTE